jgi:hypothetical protein
MRAVVATMTSQVIAALQPCAEHGATFNPPEITMRTVLILALAAFGAFTMAAMWQVGYVGIWQAGLANWGAAQVLADLVMMSLVVLFFLQRDAQVHGRKLWPYALITLAAGSFGPLLYLLLTPTASRGSSERAAA